MIDTLLSLPDFVGGLIMASLTTLVGISVYLVSYWLISRYQSSDLKDPASGLFRVIGILLSLVLSLAFGEVIVEYRGIQKSIKGEVMAIADLSVSLEQFTSQEIQLPQALLLEYTQAIIDDDWPALANDSIGQTTRGLLRQLSRSIHDLETHTPVEEILKTQMMGDIDQLYDFRRIRLNNTLSQPPVYTFVIVLGFLITAACFGVYRPQGPLIVLVSFYTAFIGVVLYLILSLSDPFQGRVGISPYLFENLVEILQSFN